MLIDLSHLPYFEVDKYSKIELFIDGFSRLFSRPKGDCHVYVVFDPCDPSDDDLPF